SDAGFTGLNRLSTVGSFLVALGVAVFLWNIVVSLRHRVPAGDDPWEGHTLEWATSSPPPRYNFRSLPPITSHAPVLDRRLEAADAAAKPKRGRRR
ncbi:MAG: cytochrome ubiquinol oxidase subunit I, partial [Solirubrobacterales bacterium]